MAFTFIMKAVTIIKSGKRDAAFITLLLDLYNFRTKTVGDEENFTDIYESDRLAQGFYESNRLSLKHL